jgi:hypothetical protein
MVIVFDATFNNILEDTDDKIPDSKNGMAVIVWKLDLQLPMQSVPCSVIFFD